MGENWGCVGCLTCVPMCSLLPLEPGPEDFALCYIFFYNFDEDMHGLIGLATPNHMVPSGQGQPHAGSS